MSTDQNKLQTSGADKPLFGGAALAALKQALFYNQKCLQSKATPDEFFKEISHKIDLEQLYKITEIHMINVNFDFCPIIVEIKDKILRDQANGYSFFLQLWNRKQQKIFEVPLKSKLSIWGNTKHYFFYQPGPEDEEHDEIHLLNFDKDFTKVLTVVKINNVAIDQEYKYVSYYEDQELLVLATHAQMKIVNVPKAHFDGNNKLIEQNSLKSRIISPKLKLFGIFNEYEGENDDQISYFAFETNDNQLDFNLLSIEEFLNDDDFSYSFKQRSEIIPRKDVSLFQIQYFQIQHKIDPIVKVAYQISSMGFSYAVVLKQSGRFDLYWDNQRKYSSEELIAFDIDISNTTLYIKVNEKGSPVVYKIDHNGSRVLTWEMAELTNPESFQYDQICNQNAQDFVNLYKDLQVISTENTYVIVSHQQYLSMFDVIKLQWVKHFMFNDEVKYFFQINKSDEDDEEDKYSFVILNNGGVYIFKTNEIKATQDQLFKVDDETYKKFTIQGKIHNFKQDHQNKRFAIIIHDESEEGLAKMSFIYKDTVTEITDQINGELKNTSNIALFQGVAKDQMTFLLQSEKLCSQYTIRESVKQEEGEEEENKEVKEEEEEEGDKKDKREKTEERKAELNEYSSVSLFEVKERVKINSSKLFDAEFKKYITPDTNLDESPHLKLEDIHSALLYKDSKGEVSHIIMIDNNNIYVFRCSDRILVCIYQQYVRSFLYFSVNVNYALCKSPDVVTDSGLFYYNLDDIIKNANANASSNGNSDDLRTLPFKIFEVGCNSTLVYSKDESRIGYFSSLSNATIIPLLHTNCIKFIGINKTTDYIVYKVIKDKFIALNKSGELQTWNLITGKYRGGHQLKGNWIQDYQVHDPDSQQDPTTNIYRKDRALIRTIEEISESKLEDFYEGYQLQPNLENQTTYIQGLNKNIYHWKYIEIVNESEIVEHLNFDFPCYPFQYLYISKNVKESPLMIERLEYSKVYLYQLVKLNDNQQKWQLIRKIGNYDVELEGNNKTFVPFYSPDFTYHIELDRKNKQFQIRETVTNNIYKKIPKDLLSYDEKNIPIEAINRIQWIDNRLIRLVNKEGIEKILDFQDDFIELHSNVIPIFDKYSSDDICELPYFYERTTLDIEQTEELLGRKYQEYQSAQNLLRKSDFVSLNQILYTVDRQRMQFNNLSFTFLHWNLISSICKETINLSEVNTNQIQSMLYNILPGGKTILHNLCESDQPDDIERLFKISIPDLQKTSDQIKYHVPILMNFNKETPLHVARNLVDYKSIDTMLKYLRFYELGHHSKAIMNLIPHLIEKNLQSLPEYLKSRMKQTAQIKELSKAKLKDDFESTFPFQQWYKKIDFNDRVINEDQIERRIKCEFIDIPEVYHYNHENFDDYFAALAGTDNYNYFALKPIQKMIEFNYPLVKEYIIKRLFFPYICFQLTFIAYNNGFFESFYQMQKTKRDESAMAAFTEQELADFQTSYDQKFIINIIFASLLILFSTFFIVNELRQFWADKVGYFTSFWNYVDILPPTLIYVSIFLSFTQGGHDEQLERSLMAVTTFFMWFKLLYFMRIFKETGYLIRMISTVMVDMRHFFLVLFIVITAFGDSFLCISMGNPEGARFTTGFFNSIIYTYTVILGGFDITTYEDSIAYALVMIIFLLCTVFNMIVMLNLLIAIISETFANVNSNALNAMFQEMASLISENNYLIPASRKTSYAQEKLNLVVITDLEAVDHEFLDQTMIAMKEMQEDIGKKIEDLKDQMEDQRISFGLVYKDDMKGIKETLKDIDDLLQEKFGKKYDEDGEEIVEPGDKLKIDNIIPIGSAIEKGKSLFAYSKGLLSNLG